MESYKQALVKPWWNSGTPDFIREFPYKWINFEQFWTILIVSNTFFQKRIAIWGHFEKNAKLPYTIGILLFFWRNLTPPPQINKIVQVGIPIVMDHFQCIVEKNISFWYILKIICTRHTSLGLPVDLSLHMESASTWASEPHLVLAKPVLRRITCSNVVFCVVEWLRVCQHASVTLQRGSVTILTILTILWSFFTSLHARLSTMRQYGGTCTAQATHARKPSLAYYSALSHY